MREATCPNCRQSLPPPTRPGRDRRYCSQECAWAASRGHQNGGGPGALRCTEERADNIAALLIQRANTGAVRLRRLRGNVLLVLLEGLAFGAILAATLGSLWAASLMLGP